MEAKELRIGNWVKSDDNGEYQVLQLLSVVNFLQPIQLTSEWFEKFGAVKDKHYNVHYTLPLNGDYGYVMFVKNGDNSYMAFLHIGDSSVLLYEDIEYVHQLQNLIYVLSGEELTTK